MGWGDDRENGLKFIKDVQPGDYIITALRRNWKYTTYGYGKVCESMGRVHLDGAPEGNAEVKKLSPFLTRNEIKIDSEAWNNTSSSGSQIPGAIYQLYPDSYEPDRNLVELLNNQLKMKEYTSLLQANRNLILTGAPGTGKTYLAKQIAEAMGCAEPGFVQFHPSYDYTDFVEGLRPIKSDDSSTIGFERRDGVFKQFCKQALKTKSVQTNFDEVYKDYINNLMEEEIRELKTPTFKKAFKVTVNTKGNIKVITAKTEMVVTKEMIEAYLETGEVLDWKPYTIPIVEDIKSRYKVEFKESQLTKDQKFVFIIDEINRGELSKIFGELFFSIDPGYRGEQHRVETQYQNLVEETDEFYHGFYVPSNVYIIGTMNDIDRSVESMDFAMRRRFVFKEVTAENSQAMLDSKKAWEEHGMDMPDAQQLVELKNRMNHLNNEITNIGLGKAYHIGAAYFFTTDFDELWNLKLEGLLREYLRGIDEADEKMDKLKRAFDDASSDLG